MHCILCGYVTGLCCSQTCTAGAHALACLREVGHLGVLKSLLEPVARARRGPAPSRQTAGNLMSALEAVRLLLTTREEQGAHASEQVLGGWHWKRC